MQASQPKKTLGKRKIPIQKIEKQKNLQVTFTKRRKGLFKKASELSILCGSQVAILVQSPAQKMFAFGHPSVESVIDRFEDPMAISLPDVITWTDRMEYDEAVNKLELEKKSLMLKEGERVNRMWFMREVEGSQLCDMEDYLEALEGLRGNVERRLKEKESENKETAEASNNAEGSSSSALVPVNGEDKGFEGFIDRMIQSDEALNAAEFEFSEWTDADLLDFKD